MYIYIYRERESARARANEVPTSREEAGRMLLNTGATMEFMNTADTVTRRQYVLDTCILILIFIIVLR